ncbi:TPA: hypothetical protein ACPOKN_001912, partial [Haemophilus influenzae]
IRNGGKTIKPKPQQIKKSEKPKSKLERKNNAIHNPPSPQSRAFLLPKISASQKNYIFIEKTIYTE